MLERIFNDKNEPFWRSAKRLEIGMIPPAKFAALHRATASTPPARAITDEALDRLLAATGGHPYGTQELAYFVWELVPAGRSGRARGTSRRRSTSVLRSEHNHFAQALGRRAAAQRLLLLALAEEPAASPYSAEYHERHDLPANPTLQSALAA